MTTTPPPVTNAVSDDAPKPPKRSAAEIEADLQRTREDLTRTVDELAGRVDPREQVSRATEKATSAVSGFVDDVRAGQPRALAILGGIVAAVGAVVAVSRRKR
ncbi:hypothetical protein Bcav_3513 [Beutenbergia cavernae DSM 12333]|uniref:DUF3618 domain-containing protein n=1 Tax=Beutenbergia cavernae (strain ATCC BAA-8 / DSM 12333 / CCUG 43141 / JCM 11478 / NBRC 16432 / NCIMB 13614 / HKI 0122) TaxID=471853 RepID=C5C2R1_BEUC1|nr:DUF3618 domain-containing protein [Beutenbergia cavernae]ACQ81755.1 hypothetical protein Bcav_3513 [Beutenbergia cavernae DSM 12333]